MIAPSAELYVVNRREPSLYKVNRFNPSDTSGEFGKIGNLFGEAGLPRSIAFHNQKLYTAAIGFSQIDIDNPSNTSGEFGPKLLGIISGEIIRGLTDHKGILYAITVSKKLFALNPNNLSDTSGNYGNKGSVTSEGLPDFLVSHKDELYYGDTNSKLFRVNPDNPSDVSGRFGLVDNYPTGLTGVIGAASINENLYFVRDDPEQLWKINIDQLSDISGSFGLIGNLLSELNNPSGATAIVLTNSQAQVTLPGGLLSVSAILDHPPVVQAEVIFEFDLLCLLVRRYRLYFDNGADRGRL